MSDNMTGNITRIAIVGAAGLVPTLAAAEAEWIKLEEKAGGQGVFA